MIWLYCCTSALCQVNQDIGHLTHIVNSRNKTQPYGTQVIFQIHDLIAWWTCMIQTQNFKYSMTDSASWTNVLSKITHFSLPSIFLLSLLFTQDQSQLVHLWRSDSISFTISAMFSSISKRQIPTHI